MKSSGAILGAASLAIASASLLGVNWAIRSAQAQTTVERNNLPLPDPAFRGKIGTTFEDSKPDFPQPVRAPKGAPNVVIILLDDLGFGQPRKDIGLRQ